jgi:excisionase family DNA binding protein
VMEQERMTVSQAARALGVAPNTVRAWTARGLLAAERTPTGHRRYDPAVIEAMRQRMREATDEGRRPGRPPGAAGQPSPVVVREVCD